MFVSQAQSPSSRAHSGHSRLSSRNDSHSVDMEDAPPASDADVCISANTSSSRMASAVSGSMLFFSSFHTFSPLHVHKL